MRINDITQVEKWYMKKKIEWEKCKKEKKGTHSSTPQCTVPQ
jgi:hypothetical protein